MGWSVAVRLMVALLVIAPPADRLTAPLAKILPLSVRAEAALAVPLGAL